MRNKHRGAVSPTVVMACVVAVAVIILLCVVAVSALQSGPGVGYAEGSSSVDPYAKTGEGEFENTIVLNGQTYRRNTRLKTVLFLGVDREPGQDSMMLMGNGGFSDAIFLLILDPDTQTTNLLSFSRNAMVAVDMYDGNDNYLETRQLQLTYQYSFSSSPRRGCWVTKNAISRLLYDIPINNCLSLTMEGIAVVVDAMGGLDLTIPEDHTEIDPSYTEGATVHLDGAAANRYIRYRDTDTVGSAEQRTRRQLQLIRTLAGQLNEASLATAVEAAGPYLESDLDADTLQQLSAYTLQPDFYELPGEPVEGQFRDEFIVDEQALRELVIELFYEPEQQPAG